MLAAKPARSAMFFKSLAPRSFVASSSSYDLDDSQFIGSTTQFRNFHKNQQQYKNKGSDERSSNYKNGQSNYMVKAASSMLMLGLTVGAFY